MHYTNMPKKTEQPSQLEFEFLKRCALSRILASGRPFETDTLESVGAVPGIIEEGSSRQLILTLEGMSLILERIVQKVGDK